MKVNRYNFDHIISRTKQSIQPINRGEENFYSYYLEILEQKLYNCHLEHHFNGRKAQEILQLVLFDIKSVEEKEEFDCSNFLEDYYQSCADHIEGMFLPDKNDALKDLLVQGTELNAGYFELAKKCIVKVHESITFWTKQSGPDGYFNYVSGFLKAGKIRKSEYIVESSFLRKKSGFFKILN